MISLADARKKIEHLDAQRHLIRDFFEGKKADDSIFDVVYNYMTLAEEDIVASIIQIMESKDMI
jgi:hypothetical protein